MSAAPAIRPAATVHRAGHDHVHDHGPHEAHNHSDHDHHPQALEPARAAQPGFSLLRLSALERLAGAAVALALLWIAVIWALT